MIWFRPDSSVTGAALIWLLRHCQLRSIQLLVLDVDGVPPSEASGSMSGQLLSKRDVRDGPWDPLAATGIAFLSGGQGMERRSDGPSNWATIASWASVPPAALTALQNQETAFVGDDRVIWPFGRWWSLIGPPLSPSAAERWGDGRYGHWGRSRSGGDWILKARGRWGRRVAIDGLEGPQRLRSDHGPGLFQLLGSVHRQRGALHREGGNGETRLDQPQLLKPFQILQR